MKILIIDSHKGTKSHSDNLHWKNSKILSDFLGADFIWSYPGVNNNIISGYDKIIFVHASRYCYMSEDWVNKSPNADLFYVTNEYNLGEPIPLWSVVKKSGRKYTVIANHGSEGSKVILKYTKEWLQVDLNALCYGKEKKISSFFPPKGCVYYGSFRKDRIDYFKKYLSHASMTLSTHSKNVDKFKNINPDISNVVPRISWSGKGLSFFKSSLYIEDVTTHDNYNHLANRFYEALNYDIIPLFDVSCSNTLKLSGLTNYEDFVIESPDDIKDKQTLKVAPEWHDYAMNSREKCLQEFKNIIQA